MVLGITVSEFTIRMRDTLRRLIARSPRLDEKLRHFYVWFLFWRRRIPGFTSWVHAATRLETPWEWCGLPDQSGELFFGYYDKTPWTPQEDRMIFHFRKRQSLPDVEILLFDRKQRECRRIGRSSAWNFQQGSMAQWLHALNDDSVIYNDVVNRTLAARIVDIHGKELAIIPYPVQTLHPSGTRAISLNYRRLWKHRQPYGYRQPVVNFSPDQPLDRDGLWRVDFQSGRGELIVSLAQLMAISPQRHMNPNRTKVNHAMYSPSGKRCAFLHRWFQGADKYHRIYCMNEDGSELRLILETRFVSHYSWRDEDTLLVYGTPASGAAGYFELNVVTGSWRSFADKSLNQFSDGHPSYSQDRKQIVTDTYPNTRFQQSLIIYNCKTDSAVVAGEFLHPWQYFRTNRCDLHPRWSPSGRFISFDSVYSGTRGSYILDVSNLASDPTSSSAR